jgi:hypothetical protein
MLPPSSGTTAVFVSIVAFVAMAFVVGVARGGRSEEAPSVSRRITGWAALVMIGWLALTGLVPASGLLSARVLPPPPLGYFFASVAVAAYAGTSRVGERILRGAPIGALVGFQAFRLPLELVLHAWSDEGVLPIQMTYSGHNFDIVTGILAAGMGLWALARPLPRWSIWAFNAIGFALLVTVATIAVLSTPVPFRQYHNDPPVLLVYHFPYAWIVPVCVGGALMGHLLVFRWLRHPPAPSAS